jgi:hypothetical protein
LPGREKPEWPQNLFPPQQSRWAPHFCWWNPPVKASRSSTTVPRRTMAVSTMVPPLTVAASPITAGRPWWVGKTEPTVGAPSSLAPTVGSTIVVVALHMMRHRRRERRRPSCHPSVPVLSTAARPRLVPRLRISDFPRFGFQISLAPARGSWSTGTPPERDVGDGTQRGIPLKLQ